ncbi:MAG: hypothetical protein GX635_00445 [Synergistaceae bacterium]|nr:hypothetical protein [Synergistaceae bacterium]
MTLKKASEVRQRIKCDLGKLVCQMNKALEGGDALCKIEGNLRQLGRGHNLPHWYKDLKDGGKLPNLDGKSLGSVVEMVFVALLEKNYFNGQAGSLRINPARGVDIPDLELGIKSPSENYCTSEPFFSAYVRLLGNAYDAVILLTNYQESKKNNSFLQIKKWKYLQGGEMADKNLCRIAQKWKGIIGTNNDCDFAKFQKIARFLSYVNQSDWEAKKILSLLKAFGDDDKNKNNIEKICKEFKKNNEKRKNKKEVIFDEQLLDNINGICQNGSHVNGLIEAADNWVIRTQKDFARFPNENELNRLKKDLIGKITISFALQWRYNFNKIFEEKSDEKVEKEEK